MPETANVIIVGAGLSGGLLAWALKWHRPDLKIVLLESRTSALSKTWCFHASDIPDEFDVFKTLVSRKWDGYRVLFQTYIRDLKGPYLALKPEDLDLHLQAKFKDDYIKGVTVKELASDFIQLEDGRIWKAPCVIDARGLPISNPSGQGYQKFVGLHVCLEQPHGLKKPTLMDARVIQVDGYRFVYVLPWGEKELLIEDTRYSDTADLDVDGFQQEIQFYAASEGWRIQKVLKLEKGALPIPFGPNPKPLQNEVPVIGVAGGFFHPVTGYSFADSARVACRIANLSELTTDHVLSELEAYRTESSVDQKYFFLLNRMMFLAAPPADRIKIFERFYSLSESLIENFYKGRLSWLERIRILSGKPPVSVPKALRSVFVRGTA